MPKSIVRGDANDVANGGNCDGYVVLEPCGCRVSVEETRLRDGLVDHHVLDEVLVRLLTSVVELVDEAEVV